MDEFQEQIRTAGVEFLKQNYKRIVLVGDYDTDGLCATSIVQKACERASIAVTTLTVLQLDAQTPTLLSEHESDAIIFVDCGASSLDMLAQLDKPVYVLDHHEAQGEAEIIHINPTLASIPSTAISSAGLTYFFALGMDKANKDLAPVAFLGALGDTQERDGLSQLNTTILQHALVQGSIGQSERLRLFGLHTRPLLKVLTYSSDLFIPGVTNNYHGAKKFLQSLNIRWSKDKTPRKYVDLDAEEQANLHDAILERKPNASDDELYVTVYIWKTLPESLQDMKELASMINACGRLGEYDIAFAALQGDAVAQEQLPEVFSRYKQLLQSTFQNLQEMQPDNEECLRGEHYVLFDLDDLLPPSMAGIVASMLARNKQFPKGTIVGVMTTFDATREKLSLRVSHDIKDVALQTLLFETFPEENISTGGHANAAGAIFPKELHDEVVARLQSALE